MQTKQKILRYPLICVFGLGIYLGCAHIAMAAPPIIWGCWIGCPNP
ncbi:Uncharacterised protein [Yersinia frederiksenii]|nr:Uncharacterised protein [Yersinia frederiksenii]CNI59081.1 Uncharacterised protein [Yersinia frederiksenii]